MIEHETTSSLDLLKVVAPVLLRITCDKMKEHKSVDNDVRETQNDEDDEPKVRWTEKPLLRQLAAASCVWSSYFQIGLYYGACPVLTAQLRKGPLSDGTVMDDEKASWISSLGTFSGIPCVLLLGLMGEYLGRKPSFLFMSLASFGGFAIFYFATSLNMLFLAQVLQGPLFGGSSNICLMVAAECVSPKYRGICLTIKSATAFWAIWLANAVGTFFHWRHIALMGMACAIYTALVISVCPESPYWLASKRKIRKCREAHLWYRGTDKIAKIDLEGLIKLEMERAQKIDKRSSIYSLVLVYIKKMSATEFYRPMLLCLLLSVMYQFSGKLVLSVYSIDIIKKITDSEPAAYTGMLILDGVSVLGMYIGCVVSRYTKRRILFFSTEFVAIISLFVISSYLYLIRLDLIEENVYLSISLLTAFSLSISTGPMLLITSLISEIIPLQLRTFSAILQCIAANAAGAISFKLAPWIFSSLGTHGAFLYFAIGSLVCAMILLKYLPETKNKTLEEIECLFKGKHKQKEMKELMPLQKSTGSRCDTNAALLQLC